MKLEGRETLLKFSMERDKISAFCYSISGPYVKH